MVNSNINRVPSNTVNKMHEWKYVYPDEAWEGVEVRDFVLSRLDNLVTKQKNTQIISRVLTDMHAMGEEEVNVDDIIGILHEARLYQSDLSKSQVWV